MEKVPYKLLLISADEKDFSLLKRQLEKNGHNEFEIEWKQSYKSALEAVESKTHDVCLFDSRFEESSKPFELLKQITSFSNHPPIIFLIDEENDQLRIEVLQAGVVCCLNKNNLNAKLLKKAVGCAVESEETLLEIRGCRVKYRDLIETLPVMFFVCEPTPPYLPVYVSPEFEKFGFPLELWTKRADFWTSRIHPDDYHKTIKKIAQSLEAKTDVDLQYRLIDINGVVRWFNDRGYIVRDEKGQPVCWQGVLLDITKTKIAENELLTLFQAMTDVILVIDKNGRYVKFAPTNTSLLYLPPGELLGRTLHDIFPVEDADKFLGYVRAALETGATQNFEYNLPIDGKEIWFNGTTAPMTDDTVLLVSRDVTAHKQAENILRRNEAELKDLFDHAPIGYHELDDQGRIVRVNQSELEMLGYAEDEMLGHFIWEFVIEEVSREAVLDKLSRRKPIAPHERHFRKKDGDAILVLVNDRLIEDDNGSVTGIRTTMQNITDIKRAEEALIASEEKYRLMGDGIMHQIWTAKPNGELAYANQRVAEYFGISPEEFILNYPNLVHPDDWEAAIEKWFYSISTGEDYIAEYRLRRHDGEYFWFHGVATAGRGIDGEIVSWFGTNTNIHDRKQAESQLTYMVGHDTLTDLSNRTEFMNHLDRTIQRNDFDSNLRFAVLFLDVDRFKLINDSLGHHTGDKLLIEIARRLKSCLRPTDTIARLGGDEFTILLTSIHHPSDAVNVAKRFLSLISEPFNINAYEIFTSASIGIVVSDDVNRRAEDFLRDADTAMYRAKSSGKNRFEIFDREMHIRNLNLLQVENDLRRAIERGEFRVFYQPIIELKTGKITKFEALIRWQHPERGLVFPDQFIEISEETGLIIPIGQIILEEACRQTVEWKKIFPEQENLCISVNLSAKQLMHPNLIKQVVEVLEKTKIAARDLNLEITESMVMEHKDKALSAMSELNELGVTLSTDDFGTGYSSLSYLHQFPFDCLKIDRSFVNKMELDEKSQAIVRTILLLAQNLNIEVIAEGIENETQLNLLLKNGCENGQGYLFSKPVPAEAASILLEKGLPQTACFPAAKVGETAEDIQAN